MVHPYSGILFSPKEKVPSSHDKTWRTLNASEKGKEVNLKRLHNLLENVSFYCGDSKKITDDQRVVVGAK